jgi:pimeloyl-ACP methyl ester carboxylesterase
MAREPAGLRRPVLILNGYHTPRNEAWWARVRLSGLTSRRASDFAAVSYLLTRRLGDAACTAVKTVERRWGKGVEVDVVGISMGGLVARLAAHDMGLRVARLFSFATPHDGSSRAAMIAPDEAARDMKPGSALLARLNGLERGYELVCYGQVGDAVVHPRGCAPPGERAFIAPGSRVMEHFTTLHNPWFMADVAKRLRGEEPLLKHPEGSR